MPHLIYRHTSVYSLSLSKDPCNHAYGCLPDLQSQSSGSLYSPNYPYVYPTGASCYFHIVANSAYSVSFTIYGNATLPSYAYIYVYDGMDDNDPLLGVLQGPIRQAATFISTTNTLYVRFIGGDTTSYLSTSQIGWIGSYSWINKVNQYFGSTSGLVLSPNYPQMYNNSLRYTYVISAPSATSIQLRILDFYTENNDDKLYLYIGYVGSGGSSNATFTGLLAPFNYTVPSNFFSLYFYSDASVTYRGFNILYCGIVSGLNVCDQRKS
uniref:CUB domain-containing protein n=1 Tax=Acrobeloides nanus TaxID=290746 RepID=A0A914CVN6_9BILA